MGRTYWSEPALEDLKNIVEDVSARRSPAYADNLATKLVEAPRHLDRLPRIGAIVPEFQHDTIREIWARPYRLISTIRGEDCHVVAIVHGSRDLAKWAFPEGPPSP